MYKYIYINIYIYTYIYTYIHIYIYIGKFGGSNRNTKEKEWLYKVKKNVGPEDIAINKLELKSKLKLELELELELGWKSLEQGFRFSNRRE